MSNLSEKFDQLPQDLDREAIWQGIEKPVRYGFMKPHLWGALITVATLVGILVLSNVQTPSQQPEMSGVTTWVDSGEMAQIAAIPESRASQVQVESSSPSNELVVSNSNTFKSGNPQAKNSSTTTSSSSSQLSQTTLAASLGKSVKRAEGASTNVSRESSNRDTSANSFSPVKTDLEKAAGSAPSYQPIATGHLTDTDHELRSMVTVDKIPMGKTLLKTSDKAIQAPLPTRIEVANRRTNLHNLSIRAGIGSHFSDFASPTDGVSDWRNDLEMAQLDYSLGLRYEYVLRHDFYLSLSAGYSLFKDRISTTFIREDAGEQIEVNYDLHNHYHVFAGALTAGKRFYQKEFFWDVNAGMGVKFYQVSEADYFVGEDELANRETVKGLYKSSSDLFFDGEAAIGRNLSSRLYLRIGAHISSRIDLTNTDSESLHKILPVGGFVEFGWRL